jgi:hypothetical protein
MTEHANVSGALSHHAVLVVQHKVMILMVARGAFLLFDGLILLLNLHLL